MSKDAVNGTAGAYERGKADLQLIAINRQLRMLGRDTDQKIANLENWAVIDFGRPYLIGDVTGHPTKGDAQDIATTRILHLDRELGFAITVNTVYRLIGDEVKLGSTQ